MLNYCESQCFILINQIIILYYIILTTFGTSNRTLRYFYPKNKDFCQCQRQAAFHTAGKQCNQWESTSWDQCTLFSISFIEKRIMFHYRFEGLLKVGVFRMQRT